MEARDIEEAAAQGLMAGVNAHLAINGKILYSCEKRGLYWRSNRTI